MCFPVVTALAADPVVPLWLLVGFAAALVGLVLRGVAVLRSLERRLARLEDAAGRLGRAAAEGQAAREPRGELTRVEGLLEDLRDVQRRLDDRLVALAERVSAPAQVVVAGAVTGSDSGALVERAQNRLLALGFEQIEVVTPRSEIEPDGAIVVEARRSGAVHKGEVRFQRGAVVDVTLRPSYELFP